MNHVNLSKKTLLAGVGLAAAVTTAAFGQAPPNNECSTAEVAILGVPAAFDNTTATASAQAVDENQCPNTFLSWGPANPDVWFRWTPNANVNVVITTCQAGSFDTSLVVYTGSCTGLTQVACNGDGTGETGCQPFYSAISLSATANTTYFIRVGSYYDTDLTPPAYVRGSGTLSINEVSSWQYQCQDPAPGVANDCAPNATVITADGNQSYYGRSGNIPEGVPCNTDGPPLTAAQCNSGSDVFDLDRWYRVTATATGILQVTTSSGQPDCAGTADLKTAVFDMGTNPATFDYSSLALSSTLVACNDDGGPCANAGFGSQVRAFVTKGRTYLVRVGYYNGDDSLITGPQVVNFDLPDECSLGAFSVAEDEACGQNTNGGCNTDATFPPVQVVSVGAVVGGTFQSTATARDTDWYQFSVNGPTQVTASLNSRTAAQVFIFDAACTVIPPGPGGAATQTFAAGSIAGGFCPISATACLPAGTYRVFVAPTFQALPCGSADQANDYRLTISGTPATCPPFVGSTCSTPGPDTQVVGAPITTINGLVACATQGAAFPACTSGASTTRNRWARVVPAAQVPDQLNCLTIGVFSVRRNVNAAGTACATFGSDIPLPAKIGIYRDVDGGAPTNAFNAANECPDGGCDMVLVNEFDVLIPGGAYKGVLNFPTPICLTDVPAGQNLVIVMDCPDLANAPGFPGVPQNSGYGIRAGGSLPTGDVSNTYCRLSCADIGQYRLTTAVGATFTANWAIELNGRNVGCGTPCPADLNDDNFVNGDDLGILLGAWGQCASSNCPADFNEDGFVNGDDLGVMLGAWGQCAG